MEDVRRDVAGAYARLHSLRLPLRRDGFPLILREFGEGVRRKGEDVVGRLREVGRTVAERYAGVFEGTDWVKEVEWVTGLFEKHGCKTTVTHGDTNFLNILVRPTAAATGNGDNDNDNDIRVVLIDYETVSYSYRGFDIGGHFSERMYCYCQPDNQLTGYSAPDVEEQRAFCEAYLCELRALGAEERDDTVEQLLLEARIGRLWHALFVNMMCTVFDDVELDPVFLEALGCMMEEYRVLKMEFEGKDQSLT